MATAIKGESIAYRVPDDFLFRLGGDSDIVLLNRSTTLNANTALTGVIEGTPVTPALAANTLIIANQTNDGDILLVASDGGNSKACLFFDASTPDLILYNVGGTWTAGATTWTIPAWTAGGSININTYNIANVTHLSIANTGSIRGAANTDTEYYVIMIRDNTVGAVEIARCQAAADPYFQIGRDDTGVATGAVTDMLVLIAGAGTSNIATSFGLGISFVLASDQSVNLERASIDCVVTNPTLATFATQFVFSVMAAGSLVAPLTLSGTQATFSAGYILASGSTNTDTLLLRANDTTFITLTTAATDVCTLAGITMSGTWLASGTVVFPAITMGGNLTFNAALDIVVPANTAAAFEISDGSNKYIAFDTRTGTDGTTVCRLNLPNVSFVSAAGSSHASFSVSPGNIALTGGVTVTAMNGVSGAFVYSTLSADTATTVTTVSTLYIYAIRGSGNVTITNNRLIDTDVAGCYCTAAGVWTDVVSTFSVKKNVEVWDFRELPNLLDEITPIKFRYDQTKFDCTRVTEEQRYGVVLEQLPRWLRPPGDYDGHGISGSVIATFTLAVVKNHEARIRELEAELALLKGGN